MLKNKFFIFTILLVQCTLCFAQKDDVSPERKHAIDSLALEKVRDLSKYISIVGNKSTQFSEANRVIDRATELFSPDAEIGVSSLTKKDIKYFTVRKYFERLSAMNYDKVKIDWYDIQYISDLQKQPNGIYVGVITIYQRFEGSLGEGMKYRDVTKKDITVYVEKKKAQIGGRTIDFWDVLLGDIRVTETKP